MSAPELPAGWSFPRLDELVPKDAPVVYGIIQPGPEVEGGVPYVRPSEMNDDGIDLEKLRRCSPEVAAKYERASLREGDVVLAIVGTIGKVAIVPKALEGGNITQSAARIRPPAEVPSGYLAHALRSPPLRAQYDAAAFGNAVQRLNVADVRALRIPLAPVHEREGLVAKLDALLARSKRAKEALDAVPALLDRLRQSILAAAFRGDLTANWREQNPDVEPASELLKRIRVERRKRWEEKRVPGGVRGKYDAGAEAAEESALDLPPAWILASWGEIGFSQNGRAFPSAEYSPTGVRLLRPGNLHVSGRVVWTDGNTRCMPEQWASKHPGHVVGGREIVINLTAQSLKDEFLGRVCMTSAGERCLLNQRIARLTPVLVEPRYAFWVRISPIVIAQNAGS